MYASVSLYILHVLGNIKFYISYCLSYPIYFLSFIPLGLHGFISYFAGGANRIGGYWSIQDDVSIIKKTQSECE